MFVNTFLKIFLYKKPQQEFAPSFKLPAGKDGAIFRIPLCGILPNEQMKASRRTKPNNYCKQYREWQYLIPRQSLGAGRF